MEINNHADTAVLGSNFLPVHDFEISVDLSTWDVRDISFECPTISRFIAYDHQISEKFYILVYHKVINCEILANHLMCPMQICMEGVNINEIPKF